MPSKTKNQDKSSQSDASPENRITQLRVMIEEDAFGNLDVMHECVIKGTTTIVPMRPSHLAGQLVAAAVVVLNKTYKKLTLTTEEKTLTAEKQ